MQVIELIKSINKDGVKTAFGEEPKSIAEINQLDIVCVLTVGNKIIEVDITSAQIRCGRLQLNS